MTLGPQFEGIHDPNKPFQLPMFMTGQEIMNVVTTSIDKGPFETLDKMWGTKLKESRKKSGHGSGTYTSMSKEGWNPPDNRPLRVWHTHRKPVEGLPDWDTADIAVGDGHHRVAAAADLERKGKRTVFFPVEHDSLQFGM